MYFEFFDGQIEEVQWLYLPLCEEVKNRKKTFTQKPAGTNFEKIFRKAEEICNRLDMTAEEFINERFIPKEAEKHVNGEITKQEFSSMKNKINGEKRNDYWK